MKAVRFLTSFYEVDGTATSIEKFAGGRTYPLTDDTQRQVDLGNAEIIDVSDNPAAAAASADKAAEAADAAVAKADQAAQAATASAQATGA